LDVLNCILQKLNFYLEAKKNIIFMSKYKCADPLLLFWPNFSELWHRRIAAKDKWPSAEVILEFGFESISHSCHYFNNWLARTDAHKANKNPGNAQLLKLYKRSGATTRIHS